MTIPLRVMSWTTIIVLNLIVGMFFYTQKGLSLFIPFACVASLAFILWSLIGKESSQDKIIVPYLTTILVLMFLNMLRALSGFASTGSTLFNAVFLLGGYFLLRRINIGIYMACFVFLWSIFQGFLQFYVAFTLRSNYINYYFGGIIAGVMTVLLGVFGVYRLICKPDTIPLTLKLSPTNRQINLWTWLILNLAALYSIIILSTQPRITPELILLWLSLIGGIILWRKIISLIPFNSHIVSSLSLLMLALYMLYLQESDIFQFEEHIALLFKTNVPSISLIFIKTMIMLYGVISLYRREAIGYMIILVTCINMILTQPIVFFIFPILEGNESGASYHYFPGMWTCLLPLIPAITIIAIIVQNYLKSKNSK